MNLIKRQFNINDRNSFELTLSKAKFELLYNYSYKYVGETRLRMRQISITLTKNMFYVLVNHLKTNKDIIMFDDIIDDKYIKVEITFDRSNSNLLNIEIYNDIYDKKPIQHLHFWIGKDGTKKLANEILKLYSREINE